MSAIANLIFSFVEYASFYLLLFSIFTFYPEQNKKEIVLLAAGSTLISYILVVTNLYDYIPIPVILIPILIVIFKRLYHESYVYCLFVTIGGFLIYGGFQGIAIKIAVMYNLLTYDTLSDPFAKVSYMFQLFSALVTVTIALYIRYTNSGFGFSFRKGNKKCFPIISLYALSICVVAFSVFSYYPSALTFTFVLGAMAISAGSIIYMSRKQDQIEFLF